MRRVRSQSSRSIDDLAAQVEGKHRNDLAFTTAKGAPLRNRNARRSWFDDAATAIGESRASPARERGIPPLPGGQRRRKCEGGASDARSRVCGHDFRHVRRPFDDDLDAVADRIDEVVRTARGLCGPVRTKGPWS